MASTTTLLDLHDLVQALMNKEGVNNYDIQVEGHSGKGENYLGEVTFFTVAPKDGKKPYNLVMKTAKRSEELRNTMPIASAYKRESYMYRKVFTAIEKFLKDLNCDIEVDYIPKIYWVCDEEKRETLIMENLTLAGYKLWNRKEPMDLNHVLQVMDKIGKHHALSLAMKDQNHIVFDHLTKNLTNIWIEFSKMMKVKEFYGMMFENVLKFLKDAGRDDLVMKYEKKMKNNIENIVIGETPEQDKLVICHGDCWNNNMLFKYKDPESSKPSAMCFLDFQLSMFNTPIKDLSYFIYTACDKAILNNFNLLLQTYHASLSSTLKTVGSNPDDLFTYQQLEEHWKKYANFGLILSMLLVRIELLNTDEAPDFSEISEGGNDIMESFNFKMDNEDVYKERMLDNFIHFGENFI